MSYGIAGLIGGLVLGVWVLVDGLQRRTNPTVYVLAAVLGFWPLAIPVYLATRPLRAGETREGGAGWNVLRFFALTWTVIMALIIAATVLASALALDEITRPLAAVFAGFTIAAVLGTMAAMWFVPMVGALVLGFFVRRPTFVETGPTGRLAVVVASRGVQPGQADPTVASMGERRVASAVFAYAPRRRWLVIAGACVAAVGSPLIGWRVGVRYLDASRRSAPSPTPPAGMPGYAKGPSSAPVAPAVPSEDVALLPVNLERTASLSVASFKGEKMTECATVTIETTRPVSDAGALWITAEQMTVAIIEETVVAAHGGSTLLTDEGPEGLTRMLDRDLLVNWWAEKAAKKKPKKGRSEAVDAETLNKRADKLVADMGAGLVWPPKTLAPDVKKGSIAKVDSCDFEGRAVLGTCSIEDSIPGGWWHWEQRHYSASTTIASDAALKRCLKVKGKWSAENATPIEIEEVDHN